MNHSKRKPFIGILFFCLIAVCSVTLSCKASPNVSLMLVNNTPYVMENITLSSGDTTISIEDTKSKESSTINEWNQLQNNCVLNATINGEDVQYTLTNISFTMKKNGTCSIILEADEDGSIDCETTAVSD